MSTKPRILRMGAKWAVVFYKADEFCVSGIADFQSWAEAVRVALIWCKREYHRREFERLVDLCLREA